MRSAEEEDRIVERALAYPYETPGRSFLQVGDRTRELPPAGVALNERVAVLALGSNAAPEVLTRKFGHDAEAAGVPVLRAELADFDVVYSAHISAYGSIPATLQRSPGTVVSTYITYLTEEQLETMSATEPNYDLHDLEAFCRLETGWVLSRVAAYLSKHGCLAFDRAPIALSSISAQGRSFAAMSEPEVIQLVRSLVSPEQRTRDFITENVADPDLARERTQVLAGSAIAFSAEV